MMRLVWLAGGQGGGYWGDSTGFIEDLNLEYDVEHIGWY
jgi:hypothetical protein